VAQHFLLSARARSLTVGAVLRMTDRNAEATFAAISESAGQITIRDSKVSSRVSLDSADKEAIMSDAPIEVGKKKSTK
jgi:hypothetical protein